jgi:hypothetical protein
LAVNSLLCWGEERDEALDPVTADAVLYLLALSGAKVRAGLPEATPDLVRVVLIEALPQFLPVAPGGEGADGALSVLRVLADRTRADGRLNAKRHARLREAVDACAGEYRRVMGDPRELTPSRLWGGLLRARGVVDVRDAEAVRRGTEELALLPYTERARLLALPDVSGDAEPDTVADARGEDAEAWALGPYRRGLAMERQAASAVLLGQRLALSLMRSDEAPWVLGLLGEEGAERLLDAEEPEEWLRATTDIGLRVAARWSVPMTGADRPPWPAPGPRLEDAALVTAVSAVADQYAEFHGEEPFAVPHPLPADREEFISLLTDSGLLAPVVRLAQSPPADAGDDPEGVRSALMIGFLARDPEGGLCAGPSLEASRERDAGELAALAVRALVELCARIGADPEVGEEFEGEILGDLLALFGDAGEVHSVARDAAVAADWVVPSDASLTAPVRVPGEPGEPGDGDSGGTERAVAGGGHVLPPLPELERLLLMEKLDEEDVAELEPEAVRLAARLDLLAGAGVVWRRGDAYGLTPLAAAVLREALMLAHGGGWPPRPGELAQGGTGRRVAGDDERWTPSTVARRFPTERTVLTLDAGQLVAAARHWNSPAAHRVLRRWLAGGEGPQAHWPELLEALAAPAPRPLLGDHRRLAARTLPDAPAGLLAGYVGDPVLGAWAAETLRAAGHGGEEVVPRSSRLLWRLDRLHARALPSWRAPSSSAPRDESSEGEARSAEEVRDQDDGADGAAGDGRDAEFGALFAEFELAAADWPGGAPGLLADLVQADPFMASYAVRILIDHPDEQVARSAASAFRECEKAHRELVREQRAEAGRADGAGGGGKERGKRGKHR